MHAHPTTAHTPNNRHASRRSPSYPPHPAHLASLLHAAGQSVHSGAARARPRAFGHLAVSLVEIIMSALCRSLRCHRARLHLVLTEALVLLHMRCTAAVDIALSKKLFVRI
jgi:hypothetical protein